MREETMSKISPHLWYTEKAAEAAGFYASIFPNSKVESVTTIAADTPSGPAGSVEVVEFTLCGQTFLAIGAGPHDPFNDAISLHVTCEDQAELDRYWNALLEGGGKAVACGWLTDRYGVRWQISPRRLGELMKNRDRACAKRVSEAMLKMVKFDIAELERAARGEC
jgi:predicted 3-demethylubiquinone-9 3-methyltransferase (glyoxalase superfamily)